MIKFWKKMMLKERAAFNDMIPCQAGTIKGLKPQPLES